MKDKKSFILYADFINTFESLKDNEAGKLIKHIFRYVNDLKPEAPDRFIKIVFEPIRLQLKRDLLEWNAIKEERSNSGKLGNLKRWNKDLYSKVISKKMTIEQAENIAKNRIATKRVAKVAVTDTVTVNKEIYKESDFDVFWDLYDKKVGDKEKIKKKWSRLSQQDHEKILEFIPKYKQSQPDKKYRKNPETFLNNKSWNDEIIFEGTVAKMNGAHLQSMSAAPLKSANDY